MFSATDAAVQSRDVALVQVARVVVTSVVTETVRPTWIFTESVVVYTNTASEEETPLPKTSTRNAEPAETPQLQTSMQSLQMDTTIPTHVSTIVPFAEPTAVPPMENPVSHTDTWPGFLGPLTIQTSWESVSISFTSSEYPSPSSSESPSSRSLVTTSLTASFSVRSSVLLSTSSITPASTTVSKIWASSSSATTPSSPSYSPIQTPLASLGSDTSPSYSSSGKFHGHSPSTGTIVGSAIGGAAVVALGLLACILFLRRKRAQSHRRQASRQRLLRTSDSISSIERFHRRRSSQPTPVPPSHDTTSAPVFHQRRYSNPLDNRPSPPFELSYPNLSHDRAYLWGQSPKSSLDDPFADLEDNPRAIDRPLSPIIEISPPTRTASIYSRSSWEASPQVVESHDSSRFSPYNCTEPTQSTLTVETLGSGSRYLNTPKSVSRRSDPFDLEPPPNALHLPLPSARHPNC